MMNSMNAASIAPSLQPMANHAPTWRHTISLQLMKFNTMVDQSTPYVAQRWIAALLLLGLFVARIVIAQGWFLITYALGIYLLNIFLAFLTPKIDPSIDMEAMGDLDADGGGPTLPTKRDEEFRPFIRRLPEFKFWYNCVRAVILALVLSLFEVTDVPVYWPILLMYFILLTVLTMRRQIRHMLKYKYVPFDIGKKNSK